MTTFLLLILAVAVIAFSVYYFKYEKQRRADAADLAIREEQARNERFLKQQEATFKKDGSYPEPRSSAVYQSQRSSVSPAKQRDDQTDLNAALMISGYTVSGSYDDDKSDKSSVSDSSISTSHHTPSHDYGSSSSSSYDSGSSYSSGSSYDSGSSSSGGFDGGGSF
jgi:uncharacterized membrane protein YgcG